MGQIFQKQRKINERSLANLKPYKPGETGNPGGRPKGTLMGAIREALTPTQRKKVVKRFVKAMQDGSFQHLKEYIEREEGKVPDRTIGGGVTVNVTQVSEDDLVRIATRGRDGATEADAGEEES